MIGPARVRRRRLETAALLVVITVGTVAMIAVAFAVTTLVLILLAG